MSVYKWHDYLGNLHDFRWKVEITSRVFDWGYWGILWISSVLGVIDELLSIVSLTLVQTNMRLTLALWAMDNGHKLPRIRLKQE